MCKTDKKFPLGLFFNLCLFSLFFLLQHFTLEFKMSSSSSSSSSRPRIVSVGINPQRTGVRVTFESDAPTEVKITQPPTSVDDIVKLSEEGEESFDESLARIKARRAEFAKHIKDNPSFMLGKIGICGGCYKHKKLVAECLGGCGDLFCKNCPDAEWDKETGDAMCGICD